MIRDYLNPILIYLLEAKGLPHPVREHRFDPERKWRFDLAWPDRMLAVEVEGGVHEGAGRGRGRCGSGGSVRGRHLRAEGFRGDMEKYNRAVVLGWRLLRTTPEGLYTEDMVAMIAAVLRIPAFVTATPADIAASGRSHNDLWSRGGSR